MKTTITTSLPGAISRRDLELVAGSAFFDTGWYLQQYSDVAEAGIDPVFHYLMNGAAEGRDPSPWFKTLTYIDERPDVRDAGVNPLVHYLRYGIAEILGDPSAQTTDAEVLPANLDEPLPVPDGYWEWQGHANRIAIVRLDGKPSAVEALPPNSGNRKLICVTHVMPWPSRAGNEYRTHRMLAWAASTGWDVTLIVAPLPGEEPDDGAIRSLAAVYPRLIIVLRDGRVLCRSDNNLELASLNGRTVASFAQQLAEQDHGTDLTLLNQERTFAHNLLLNVVIALVSEAKPAVVLVNYVFMSRVLPLLPPSVLKVLDTIDVFSTKSEKVKRFGIADGSGMTKADESRLLSRADVIIAIQDNEHQLLKDLAPGKRVIKAGVDFDLAQPVATPTDPIVLLVASGNPLNVKGLYDFLKLAWPLVQRAVPETEFLIVGNVGNNFVSNDPAVKCLGKVADLAPLYSRARVVVNPAVAGTGLKIKTVEALSYLRPVVAWSAGVEGLPLALRQQCRVALNWYEFSRHVIAFLKDEAAAAQLQKDREQIAEFVSPEHVYSELQRVLGDFCPRSPVRVECDESV